MRRKVRSDAQRASSCLSLAGGAATSAALDRKKATPMQERPGSLGRKRPRRAVVLAVDDLIREAIRLTPGGRTLVATMRAHGVVLATPSRARQGSIYPVQCSKQGHTLSVPHKFVRM